MNYDEILKAIDDIDTVTLESEISVCSSMLDVYGKMKVIAEYYEGDSIEAFSVYQEGFKDDVKNEMKKSGQGKNSVMKILTVVPRLIMAVIKAFKKKNSTNSSNKELAKRLETAISDPKNKAIMGVILGTGAAAAGTAVAVSSVKKHKQKKMAEAEAERKKLEEEAKKIKEAKEAADKKAAFDGVVKTLNSYILRQCPKNIDEASKMISQIPKAKSIAIKDALIEMKDVMIEPSNQCIKKCIDIIKTTSDIEITDDIRNLLKNAETTISENNKMIEKIDNALKTDVEKLISKHRDRLNNDEGMHVLRNGQGIDKEWVVISGDAVWVFLIKDYLDKTTKAFKHFAETNNISDEEKKILTEKTDLSSFGKEINLHEALKLYSGDYIDHVVSDFEAIAEADKKVFNRIDSIKDKNGPEYQESMNLLNSMKNELVVGPDRFINDFFKCLAKHFEPLLHTLSFFYTNDIEIPEAKNIGNKMRNKGGELYPQQTEVGPDGIVWYIGGAVTAKDKLENQT